MTAATGIEQIVHARFREVVGQKLKSKPGIVAMVMDHERLPLVLDRLCQEVRMMELRRPSTNLASIHRVVDDVALFFARNAIEAKEKELMSDGERIRRTTAAGKIEDMKTHMVELEREATTTATTSYRHRSKEE